MRVTVLCDASFCPRYKVAGYGYWIASSRGKVGGQGQIARVVQDNNVAEAMAICNTIWHATLKGLIYPGDEVLVQSDCLRAMDLLRSKKIFVRTPEEREVHDYFAKIVQDLKLTIEFRHVKAHVHDEGKSRLKAQATCDKRARQAMRAARRDHITKFELEKDDA